MPAVSGTCRSHRTTKRWRPRTGALVAVLPQPDGRVVDAAFSPDGSRLATASRGGSVGIWDVASGQQLQFLTGATNFVQSVSFSPDGGFVVAGSRDRTARVYRVGDGAQVASL